MAFGSHGFILLNVKDIFQNDSAQDWPGDTWKLALYPNTITPNFDTDTAYGQGAGAWTLANECTGTNYVAGGTTIVTPTLAISSGALVFDSVDPVFPSNMSVPDGRGVLMWNSTVATPTDNAGLMAITFGVDVPVVNGVLTVNWPVAGIASVDLTP